MAASTEIDHNLYSRQLGVFGVEAMGKLIQQDVLIIGMRGLGVEIAKNLILAGPRSVTIFDPTPATLADCGSNYYIHPSHVGTARATACVEQLSELNNYVRVAVLAEPALTEAVLKRFNVVVFTSTPREELVRWNAFCHAQTPSIAFLAADVAGVAGWCFSDFGPAHVVKDGNGENTKSAVVVGISKGAKTVVFTHDAKRHGLEDGGSVVFREVEGMTELNDGVPRRITNCKAYSFELEGLDSSAMGDYVHGGIVEQVKVSTTVAYEPIGERIIAPVVADEALGFITPDLGKFGRSEQLHIAFQGVEAYRAKHGQLPPTRDAAAAAECVELAKAWLASTAGKPGALPIGPADVDAAVVTDVAQLARVELPALCAFYGGIVAQEVVKVTGKFTPIRQWLYTDAFEVLPKAADGSALPAEEFGPQGNRYDQITSIIGRTLQGKVMDQRVFVVGAGALGCEFLKNFALMGVGCGPRGRITVTDMDRIEVSNLNRQFLFRAYNVGQPKSVTAAAAARAMNPEMKIEALEVPVGPDTENTFNDAFWEGLDFVTNALDNIKARQYVDQKCVWYAKPLLESGTLGTKANTQVVLPYKTETYSDSQDPPEESIPMCTLRNFPHAIEHCIEWARDLFQGTFNNSVQDASSFAANPEDWLRKADEEANMVARRMKLEGVLQCVEACQTASFASCVAMARHAFNASFYLQIRQLLHNFPVDHVNEQGVKFWSGPKRAPTAAVFDLSDPLHYAFMVHATALFASNYGVELPAGWDTPEILTPLVTAVPVPEFAPRVVRIKTGEADQTVEGGDDDREAVLATGKKLSELATSLGPAGMAKLKLSAAEFEKDDDSNHHIDFITAAANLRATNYKINTATRHEVKMTAGKIIPAIATTTCTVTGLVCVEAYKMIEGAPVESFRNAFINLAVNVYSFGEPGAPKRTKSVADDPVMGAIRAMPEGFTHWDKVVVKEGNLTPLQLEQWLQKAHGVKLSMIMSGANILYNPIVYRAQRESRGNTPLKELWEQCCKTTVQAGRKYLVLDVSVYDDISDVTMPPLQLYFE